MIQPPAIAILRPAALLGQGGAPTGRIFWAVLGLAVAVIVLVAIAMVIRRFLLSRDEPERTPGFTLAEMRRLRDAGELSDEEYERVRAALVSDTRSGGAATPSAAGEKSTHHPPQSPKPGSASDRKAEGDAPDPDDAT